MRVTRVVDDFVISSCSQDNGPKVVDLVESGLDTRGLEVNSRKKLEGGYRSRPDEVLVHGLTVSDGPGVGISKAEAARLVAKAERYVKACRSVTGESFETLAATRRSLDASRSRCRQMSFGPAKPLDRLIKAGDRHVARKLDRLLITSRGNRWWIKNRKAEIDEGARISKILLRRSAH